MRAGRALAAAGTVVALAAGCGSETPPAADDVPALADALVRVETTVAEERYPAARSAIETLVEDTTAARQAGDLSGDQAEAVLAAADALLEALPGQEVEPEEAPDSEAPEPAPLEQSPLTTLPDPETTDDSDADEDSDSDEDEKPGKGEKPEKPDKPEKDDKPDKDEKDDDD